MVQLLLVIIYITFISLGLPYSLLGAAWPSMYSGLKIPISYAGIISMIITWGLTCLKIKYEKYDQLVFTGAMILLVEYCNGKFYSDRRTVNASFD
jgi:hypothetical protein